jgi:hypothetical protein
VGFQRIASLVCGGCGPVEHWAKRLVAQRRNLPLRNTGTSDASVIARPKPHVRGNERRTADTTLYGLHGPAHAIHFNRSAHVICPSRLPVSQVRPVGRHRRDQRDADATLVLASRSPGSAGSALPARLAAALPGLAALTPTALTAAALPRLAALTAAALLPATLSWRALLSAPLARRPAVGFALAALGICHCALLV